MQIVNDYPPIYNRLKLSFQLDDNKNILFAYGDRIYNPKGKPIPSELLAHEQTHLLRQMDYGLDAWWDRYIEDIEFRAYEELLGHQAEFKAICKLTKDRNHKARALHSIAVRLSGPLYGRCISYSDAIQKLKE